MNKHKSPMNKRIKEFLSTTGGGSFAKSMMVVEPLVIMFNQDDKLVCHIHPRDDYGPEAYGLIVCDLVRHAANAFGVHEDDIWEWVDKERRHPTTEIAQAS
jgi:hypothetical protein